MADAPKNLLKGNTQNTQSSQGNQKQPSFLAAQNTKNKEYSSKSSWFGRRMWIPFVLGLILGLVLSWLLIGQKEEDAEMDKKEAVSSEMKSNDREEGVVVPSSSSLTENVNTPAVSYQERREAIVVSGSNEISVQNQEAGEAVEVELAKFSVSGWVAIHEDNGERENNLGNILGAKRLDPGIHLTEVPLLRTTNQQSKYHAVLYVDDGDKQFDSSKDAPIKNAEGELIESIFVTN